VQILKKTRERIWLLILSFQTFIVSLISDLNQRIESALVQGLDYGVDGLIWVNIN
jgi:hypothetical protein